MEDGWLPILESRGSSEGGSLCSLPTPGELEQLDSLAGENGPQSEGRGVVNVGVDNMSSLIIGVISIFGVFRESRGDRSAAILVSGQL